MQVQKNTDMILGLQWGDEGKGKIVDLLTKNYQVVLRANGGNNAGHSISVNNKTFAVHSLPSGVLQKGIINIIGPGCVVNPDAIIQEINTLGDDFKGELVISDRCPLILNKHIQLDIHQEQNKGSNSIGTTLKGIGPSYADLKNRNSILAGDLLNIDQALTRFSHLDDSEKSSLKNELFSYKLLISKYIKDISPILLKKDINILIEGAQATMLDNTYGTYPFVTSSNTISSSLLTGSSLNYQNVRKVIGVTKAYTTRVGNGPFITEDLGYDGDKIRKIGKEVGVSTGRPRRTGWLDLVQLKYAIQLNGITNLSIMKSDVLDHFSEIKVCIAYKNIHTGDKINYIPFDISQYKPVYKNFEGWKSNTFGLDNYDDLPAELIDYLEFIANHLDVKLSFVSTGPERSQICFLD